ncbi:MAG: copper-binding protein [Methylobacterium sp.]|uniref:copper-binding protein n=1 Tax=Methylobacterium sp. TaxID=409 RepID=UPI0025D3B75C|nr:copper-binding protein [Methylobacterium sp.]MBX9934613.1 copper-binding protein [Methylobacterium sp.]
MTRSKIALMFVALLAFASPALASMSGTDWLNRVELLRGKEPGAEAPWIKAKVETIDPQSGEVTIKHDAIPKIDMPAMSMTFPIADRVHLTKMKAGDTMEFQAANQDGVVRIVNVRMNH